MIVCAIFATGAVITLTLKMPADAHLQVCMHHVCLMSDTIIFKLLGGLRSQHEAHWAHLPVA